MDGFKPDITVKRLFNEKTIWKSYKMLLTLINSLNSTMLLIAIQTQKPVFESP